MRQCWILKLPSFINTCKVSIYKPIKEKKSGMRNVNGYVRNNQTAKNWQVCYNFLVIDLYQNAMITTIHGQFKGALRTFTNI